jgi:hypothetical protein
MPWQRTEARIVKMLQTYCDEPEKPVKDLTTWLERLKLTLLESLIRAKIETKPDLPIGYATEAERRKIEEWFWQMEYRHIKLTELEQEFREIYETAITNFDTTEQLYAVPDKTVNKTVDKTVDKTVELPETAKTNVGASTIKLHLPATVELELSAPILTQHRQKLLIEVSSAQSQSELIDEEEACAGITESTIDALMAALQVIDEKSCAVDAIDGDYRCPVLRVQPTDRPPPQPGQELMDEEEACAVDATCADHDWPVLREACAVNATGADDVLLVLRVCASM